MMPPRYLRTINIKQYKITLPFEKNGRDIFWLQLIVYIHATGTLNGVELQSGLYVTQGPDTLHVQPRP